MRRLLPVVAVLALLGTGCAAQPETVSAGRADGPDAAAATSAPAASSSPHPGLAEFRSRRDHDEVARPVRLAIPRIGVTTGLESLRRAGDLSIEVPQDPDLAGWWTEGPRPGQAGPAVVLGHVNSRTGPAVFARVDQLLPGDEVVVERADGSTARFLVTHTEQHPKAAFPTELVYHPTLRPELRLVTCGGTIDPRTGHHRDNVIVFASLAA